jgi:hypothetical protein
MVIPTQCRKANATVLAIVKGETRMRAGREATLDEGCAQRRVERRSGRGNSYGKAGDRHH